MQKNLNDALLLMKDGNYADAIDKLEDILESDPQNREALFHLALCHCEREKPEKAVRVISKCLEHHPAYADGYVALGYMQAMLKQNGPARENFLKALEIDSANAFALQNLGSLYGNEKDYEKAIECFEKSLAINPEDQQAAYSLGFAYYQTGKLEMAEKYLIVAIDLDRSTQLAEMAMNLMRDVIEKK